MKRRRKSEDSVGKPQKLLAPPLSVRQFDALIQETWVLVSLLSDAYFKAHEEQGWPSGGEGLHVSGSPDEFGSVVNTIAAGWQHRRRSDCLTATEWLRKALGAAENALAVLQGERVEQPRTVHPMATMKQDELDDILNRLNRRDSPMQSSWAREREQRRREDELRSG